MKVKLLRELRRRVRAQVDGVQGKWLRQEFGSPQQGEMGTEQLAHKRFSGHFAARFPTLKVSQAQGGLGPLHPLC